MERSTSFVYPAPARPPAAVADADAGPRASLSARSARLVLLVFGATIFLGAFLTFLVQPMVGKMMLPLLGGGAAIWNVCMVFFQTTLLAGYGYAHVSGKLPPRLGLALHVALLALPLLVLPICAPAAVDPPGEGTPAFWLLGLLASVAGLPFFVVSTTGPLVQRWFGSTCHPAAKDPYFLYAASNAGSLLALLGYPLVVERTLGVAAQARLFSFGYVGFLVLATLCGGLALVLAAARPAAASAAVQAADEPPATRAVWRQRLGWVFLAFIPSSLVLGTTERISTDIAALPLLWVIPFSLYLVSLILPFGQKQLFERKRPLWVWPALGLLSFFVSLTSHGWFIPAQLGVFFALALLCHLRLARSRPAPSRLTEFYLALAVGGALGGVFNSLLAPLIFPALWEVPIATVLALFATRPRSSPAPGNERRRRVLDLLLPLLLLPPAFLLAINYAPSPAGDTRGLFMLVLFALPVLILVPFFHRPWRFGVGLVLLYTMRVQVSFATTTYRERTFYGQLAVVSEGELLHLVHGSTRHGSQDRRPEHRHEPLSYYGVKSPVGEVFDVATRADRPDKVAVLGLGVGTLAAFGQADDEISFFELDPAVVRIARDPRFFTFLADSPARVDIRLGDGRLNLAKVAPASFGLIVLDAFSSDAIPVHLLTTEAVRIYFDKLAPDGLLTVHVSNRFFELRPMLARLAADAGLAAIAKRQFVPEAEEERGQFDSVYVVLGRQAADLAPLLARPGWKALTPGKGTVAWTDGHADVLSALR